MVSAILVVLALSASALEQNIKVGAGTQSCGAWVQHYEGAKSDKSGPDSIMVQVMTAWTQGFLMGATMQMPRKTSADLIKEMQKIPDAPSIQLWLTNSCREHPLEDVMSASIRLMNEIWPR